MKPWAQAVIALCIATIVVCVGFFFSIFFNAAFDEHMASLKTAAATDTVGAKPKSPATDQDNLRTIIAYVKAHRLLVVWLKEGQREVWTIKGDIIELDFYTGSGPLTDPPYDPGTVFVKIEDGKIKFGSENHKTKKVEWTTKEDFGFSAVLNRAIEKMKKESG